MLWSTSSRTLRRIKSYPILKIIERSMQGIVTHFSFLLQLKIPPFTAHRKHITGAFLLLHQATSAFNSSSWQSVAAQLKDSCSRVLVMTGAGLSTASGIPDFRSPGTGLYSNLEKYKLPYPEAIFDLTYFQQNPKPFLSLAQELYPGGKYRPNIGHHFVRLLEKKKKLLRVFTQNIDGLERLAGLSEELLVEAHGSFSTASCLGCRRTVDSKLVQKEIMSGITPKCSECKELVKPDIVFFGEQLPERYAELSMSDPFLADFLIVIGTSLQVYPFAGLADMVPSNVTRVLINRDSVGTFGSRDSDVVLNGDITAAIETFTKELGWWDDLQELVRKYDLEKNVLST